MLGARVAASDAKCSAARGSPPNERKELDSVCVCVCVCVGERERERKRERERETWRASLLSERQRDSEFQMWTRRRFLARVRERGAPL